MENNKTIIKQERNYSIDFLRGIAVISIIAIHTAWWSGQGYLPAWFSNLFLLIDVPVFIFISGISFSYHESVLKTIKGIVIQWKKWIFFLGLYSAILIIFWRNSFHIKYLVNWIFYRFPATNPLRVVSGSIWFIPMYMVVSILCALIISTYKKSESNIAFKYILLLMLLIAGMCSNSSNFAFLNSTTAIFSFIFLLGYYASSNKIQDIYKLIMYEIDTLIVIYLVFKSNGYKLESIQSLKFPATIYYMLVSFISIFLFWYLKDQIKIKKNNPINYLGKNAIFFYYSQGIGSSLLFLIRDKITLSNIYIKFIILLIINLIISILIGIVLNELYTLLDKKLLK